MLYVIGIIVLIIIGSAVSSAKEATASREQVELLAAACDAIRLGAYNYYHVPHGDTGDSMYAAAMLRSWYARADIFVFTLKLQHAPFTCEIEFHFVDDKHVRFMFRPDASNDEMIELSVNLKKFLNDGILETPSHGTFYIIPR